MKRTRIKFCGFTRAEDVHTAITLGVDALGLVLVPASRRALSIEQAVQLRAQIPPFASAVLLFQRADAGLVREAIAALKPDLLQFHGGESAAYCEQFALPYLYVLGMGGVTAEHTAALTAMANEHAQARALLLDTHAGGALGGQGQSFDWRAIPQNLPKPMVLAGGLRVESVAQAVREVQPYAVDVSSGIESAPGIKDPEKMRGFVQAVAAADHALF